MKLSVIVPVYNVEQYLPRCLDSLLRQGLESGEWDIICVNDGSQDNSAAILVGYEQRYPDIFKVITQENRGLGEARNTGMTIAQGDWIAFLDSDDYVIDDGYRYILDHFCEEKVDVIHFAWLHIYTDGKTLYDPNGKADGEIIYDGNASEAYNNHTLPCVWSKFYRRAFLEKCQIHFETPFLEDEPFNFEVFLNRPHLRVVTSNIYRYEQGNTNSLMSTVDKEKVKTQLDWLLLLVEKMKKYQQDSDCVLCSAASRNAHIFSVYYYNKMLKAGFTRSEWRHYSRLIKLKRIYKFDVSQESSFLGKSIALLKNGSGSSYLVYLITAFFLYKVFLRWIRPRIIGSNS